MAMTRDEHVAWCKKRAREYLDKGDIANGVTSMLSDMDKHPECRVNQALSMLGMAAIMQHDLQAAKRFVDGFH